MSIELVKLGEKVSLAKDEEKGFGEITVNLSWNKKVPQPNTGLLAKLRIKKTISVNLQLDLGCLIELKDGRKGVVQTLGNNFGSLTEAPYIQLDDYDGHERILRINGDMIAEIKRVLFYAYVCNGVAYWEKAGGVATLKQPNGEDLVVRIDEHENGKIMCAIALLSNEDDETLSFERVVKFYNGHEAMDKDFKWGMKWRVENI